MKLRDLLFPYRSHLEQEVEWLKHQLAQEKRRSDALMERLSPTSTTATPAIPPATVRPRVSIKTQPLGWDAYREQKRQEEVEDGVHS